jgi:hypothetical protein
VSCLFIGPNPWEVFVKYLQFISHRPALRRAIVVFSLFGAMAFAQNPVPQIVGPVSPQAVMPGSAAFTLTVYGANFVSGAVVNWNYQARSTTFVSGHELQAQILATDVAQNTAGYISVTNPAPGGGNSSAGWGLVEVHAPTSSIVPNKPSYYSFGGWLTLAADFNRDGILDLVGQYFGDLSFYFGKGNGKFQFGSIAGRAYSPGATGAYGDFNGDGNLDLLFPAGLGNYAPTQITVMLGDGKGKFNVGSYVRGFTGLSIVAVGDFNRDGKLDLIARKGSSRLSIFLGNGDGTFQAGTLISTLADIKLITGDFNGDGKLDLLVEAIDYNKLDFVIYELLGNGDGTFQQPQAIATTSAICTTELAVDDFNADGKPDIVFCNPTQIGVLIGNGDGTFQAPVFYTVNTNPNANFSFACGDFNADGKTDLIVSQYVDFQFSFLPGNGDGTFQSPQSINLGQSAGETGIVVGDFNSDGLLDFLFQGNGMSVYTQK